MDRHNRVPVVGITAGSAYDLSIERAVFDGMDIELKPVDVSSTDDLRAKLNDVDAIIDRVLTAPYTAEVISSLSNCTVISRCGIGVDKIDIDAATEHEIYVTNVPSYCEQEVSTHTLQFILALERNLLTYNQRLTDGRWQKEIGTASIHRLEGQTLGLVGFGKIARLVAKKAQAFGMDVIAYDPYIDTSEMAEAGVTDESFRSIIETADFVSTHVPLTDETAGQFDSSVFERMKESAYFINVARGGLVVESDLVSALKAGEIAGAALDVFQSEPADRFDSDTVPEFDNPLRELDNVLLTPHVAWYSIEASNEKRRVAATDVRSVLEGERPENAVNDPIPR